MAEFYQSGSRRPWESLRTSVILTAIFVSIIIILYFHFIKRFSSLVDLPLPYWVWFLFVIPVLALALFSRKLKTFRYTFTLKGLVKKELSKLPMGYTVFENVIVPGEYIKTDFVLIGDTGIYAVTVLSRMLEKIRFTSEVLIFGEREVDRDFIRRTVDNTKKLSVILEKKTGFKTDICTVLVIAGVFTKVSTDPEVTRDILIVRNNTLIDTILQKQTSIFGKTKEKICEELKDLL